MSRLARFRSRHLRLGKHLDWRLFAKRFPECTNEIKENRKNQLALVQIYKRLVIEGKIRPSKIELIIE